jgi:hypothetical protein
MQDEYARLVLDITQATQRYNAQHQSSNSCALDSKHHEQSIMDMVVQHLPRGASSTGTLEEYPWMDSYQKLFAVCRSLLNQHENISSQKVGKKRKRLERSPGLRDKARVDPSPAVAYTQTAPPDGAEADVPPWVIAVQRTMYRCELLMRVLTAASERQEPTSNGGATSDIALLPEETKHEGASAVATQSHLAREASLRVGSEIDVHHLYPQPLAWTTEDLVSEADELVRMATIPIPSSGLCPGGQGDNEEGEIQLESFEGGSSDPQELRDEIRREWVDEFDAIQSQFNGVDG